MRGLQKIWMTPLLLLLAACGGGSGTTETGAVVVVSPPVTVVSPTATPTPVATAEAVTPNTMVIGAVTHFAQQGWDFSILDAAKSINVTVLRDEVAWSTVEKSAGVYQFSSSSVSYLDTLISRGFSVTLLFQGSNPLYDGGNTPNTDAGRAAFAKFIVATLNRFPGVKTIEIGNEYNAWNFVTGPVLDANYGPRQKYYYDMLRTVQQSVKESHPAVKILGGAALSIPVGYYKTLFGLGALQYMDGIVIHPYTTDPEQLEKQLAILRMAMGSNPVPIYVTEFAQELDSAADTASYLVKAMAVMGAAGIAQADWYALRQQGSPSDIWYKNVALTSFTGNLLPPGQALKMMTQQVLAQGAGRRLAIDDFTYAYQFGRNAIVLWGETRNLTVTTSATFYNAQGQQIAQPTTISAKSPVIIVSTTPLIYGSNVNLGSTQLVADSYDQFDFTNDLSGSQRYEGAWSYYAYGTRRQTFDIMYSQGGGEIRSSDWTPYIGSDYLRPLVINANRINPVDFGTVAAPDIYKPVLRYTSTGSGMFDITGVWDVAAASVDGIDLTVQVNAQTVLSTTVAQHYDMAVRNLSLKQGDVINIIVGTNKTVAGGDLTDYRIKIYRTG